jgi:hypothetical protein
MIDEIVVTLDFTGFQDHPKFLQQFQKVFITESWHDLLLYSYSKDLPRNLSPPGKKKIIQTGRLERRRTV